jgi:methylmalonyl-CoA mutase cobalamin-binding subunit
VGIRDETVFVIGGVFSPQEGETLAEMGFEGVFPPGSRREEILSCLRRAVERRRPQADT